MKSTATWFGCLAALVLGLAWKTHKQQEQIDWLRDVVKHHSALLTPR